MHTYLKTKKGEPEMKQYEKPEIEILQFNVEDIMEESNTDIPDAGEWN